jgi:uncharacterized protein (TIGR03000 family)
MMRSSVALTLALCAGTAQASWLFPKGVGDYGPYTGGHGYSYNVAYSYGFTWSAADSWRRDIFAYPGGVYPYRPYEKPIYYRVFPKPETPYISVPGPDGLPMLIQPVPGGDGALPPEATILPLPGVIPPVPPASPHLLPVPDATAKAATIRVRAPDGAEVWVEKEKLPPAAGERTFQTPPLSAGKIQIFSVRAKWTDGGREVEQFRVVGVKAGETAKVAFGAP